MAEEKLSDFFDSQRAEKEPGPAEPPAKNGRRKRKPRKQPTEAATTEAAPKRERKKREPKANGERKPRAAKVDLPVAIAALAGLKVDEAQMVAVAATRLAGMPKKSRGRIVAALARMFA